jgi:beta-N-acetylhexosaminidase
MDFHHMLGQRLLFSFHGKEEPSPELLDAFNRYRPAGVTLFRSLNLGTPIQIRTLTTALQTLAGQLNLGPLLIGADQEGGQLMAIGDGTPLPGNMAIGATRSADLAFEAGVVLGRELACLGININYAPCVDVNVNPFNPVVGIRSFGEDPGLAGELAAAMIRGIQSQGVAATAKHFPGHGDTTGDSHHSLPQIPHTIERLHAVELVPFIAAMKADVRLMMTAHIGIPAIDGPDAPPATLSEKVIGGLLRRELGYDGVVISDALDMRAIGQGSQLGENALRAVKAGVDLLLVSADTRDQQRVYEALLNALQDGKLTNPELQASLTRIARLKTWLSEQPPAPDLGALACANHRRVAEEIAERSVTLVQDRGNLLPLRLDPEKTIAVVVPLPQDLTPADTSSYVKPKLAESLRAYHSRVHEIPIPLDPDEKELAETLARLQGYDLVVIGTINAFTQAGQAELVRRILSQGIPLIVIAMRLPYDLMAFPETPTYVCTYSILEPSMQAVARALFGQAGMSGKLPVTIPTATPDQSQAVK